IAVDFAARLRPHGADAPRTPSGQNEREDRQGYAEKGKHDMSAEAGLKGIFALARGRGKINPWRPHGGSGKETPLWSYSGEGGGMPFVRQLIEARNSALSQLAAIAADMFDVPIALVSLLDGDRQVFVGRHGLEAEGTPIEQSFCRHAVAQASPLVVPDAGDDARFCFNGLVRGEPGIRFYAGVPLRVHVRPGQSVTGIGAFCLIDTAPREFSDRDLARLSSLACGVEAILQSTVSSIVLAEDAARINRLYAAQQRLQRQFRQAERMAAMGSWRLDVDQQTVTWSEGVYDIHDLPPGDGKSVDDALSYYPPADRRRLTALVEQAIATGAAYDVALAFISARGGAKRVRAIGEPELEDGRVVGLIGVFHDVTERHEMFVELDRRANTDEVTLVASRHRFVTHVDECVAQAQQQGERLALMLIDLDNFKQVNDTFGHATGDDILRKVAAQLRSPWLNDCLAARLGGDDFALVITDPAMIEPLPRVADHLLRALRFPLG
ncbi:hypothetical protein E4T56_gene4952, partial [Termitomyces sp. T112]